MRKDLELKELIEGKPVLADYVQSLLDKIQFQENLYSNLTRVLSASQDIIYTLDADQRHTGVYGAWLQSSGLTPEHFLGKSVREIMGETHALIHEEAFLQATKGQAVVYRWSMVSGNNEEFFETSLSPIWDETYGFRGVVGIGRNVTESIRQSKFIEDNKIQIEKLQMAVDQSPASVVVTDIEGNIEYVNNKFIAITGYEPSEVIGKNPRILKSGTQDLSFYQKLWHTITSGKTWKGELRNRKKNGQYYWESASITPIQDRDGNTINFLGIKEDITERKKQELVIQESEKRLRNLLQIQEDQNKRLQNFNHILSHNIRSQTANLEGIINLIQLEDESLLNNPYMQAIVQISHKMAETIQTLNETLHFSESASSSKRPVNLLQTIRDVTLTLSHQIQESKVAIQINVPESFQVLAVKNFLFNILLNLVQNSIQFRNTERESNIHIAVEDRGLCSLITVSDNGLGIDLSKHKNKIFEMYKTFHSQDKSKGLGLFMVKNQVLSMNGVIDIESEPGKGTIVKVCLPNAEDTACNID